MEKYKVIEVYNKNGKDIKDVVIEVFKNYVKRELNLYNDLNIK